MTCIDVAASGTLSIVADDPEAVPSLINGSGQYGLRAQVYTDLAEALDCAGRVAPDAWVVAVGDPTFAWGICGLLRSCSEERLRAIPIFLVLSESSMQQMAPALEAQAIYLCSDALTSPDALLSQISRRLSGRTVRPLRVLLCSSHIDQAILHVTALRQAGHMVYWATGVQTPRHGWLADYDVLLIDAAAASPDGMLCVGNGVRCVAYNVDPSSTREWLERGVVRCLESPCTPHELRDALEALPIPSPEGGGTPVQEPARDRVLQSVHHSAMAAADMGVWEWDVDSGTNWWSPELWRLYDLDQTVVPSYEAWLSSVHPDQRDALHHAVQQAIASSEPIRIEWRVATRDGSERWLAARGDLDRTPGRVTRRYIGAVADVTERRRMEEHAMTLAHMLDVAPNAITVHDDSGRFLYANQQTFTMHGIDPEAFLATNLYDLDTPESAALILQRIHELDQAGDLTFEVDHYRGDGSVIPLEVYARRVVWQGRRAVLSVARDISKRRQAQRQLADSERFLRAVLESTVDGFWVVEADGTLSDVNPAYCHMMGYTRDALIGKTVGDIDLLETPRQTAERMARIWEKGSEMFETVHRRADGRPLDVEMSVTYLPEKGGRYVCFCRDITERKRTAEALQQLTRRMMLATRIGQIGVWEYDVETGRCFWDDTQFEMFGLPTGDSFITMDTWLERVHPEDVERIRREIASFDLHKGLYETEYRAVRPNGQVRFIRVMAVGVADEVGRIRRVVGVNTDITDFRQAEAQLRASEAQYRALVESIPDYVVRYDRDARMLYVSPNLSAASGIPAEHYIGRTQRELGSPPELCDLWESAVRQVVADGRPYETEFAMTSASGEVATFNWRLVPQFGEDGTVETVLSIARDVSAQRRLEQDYEQLFQQMAEGFVLLEPVGSVDQPADYRFCTVNRAFETLCGLTAHEVIGRTVRDFWPDVNPRWFECFSHVLRTGAPLQLQEWSDEIHKHLSVSVYRPSPTRVAMVFSDITEHLKSQQEQTRLQAQLTQAQKMESIGRLAGGVAHDFNNMLGVIIGRTDMLMRQEMPAAVARGVQEIRRAAKSSADLTRQLLAFARQQDVTPQSVDLNEALSGMLKMLRRLIGEHLQLEWLPGSDIGHVWIDPAQVDQLLANLCVNARDAIEGHGTITIRTERVEWDVDMDLGLVRVPAGAYVRLSVSDTGCGMDAETLSHVFEPFFTTKPEGRGTGLGLATVYGIVTQNHGWIDVVSQPGEGSRFDIYFPEHRAPAEMAHDVHQSDAPEGEATVLLVEDEPSILAVTRMMLQSCGYQVLSCSAPDEALALARSHPEPIHLLLTDVVMPVANGVALAEQIRSVRPEIRVLYMSGYTADMLADQGLEEMGPLFLAKPFTREALARAVNAVLSCDVT